MINARQVALALGLAAVAVVPATAASGSGSGNGSGGGGGVGTIVSPVTAAAVCTGTSQMSVTVKAGPRKTVEVVIVSTNLTSGFWMRNLTTESGSLIFGAGGSLGVSGGATLTVTTSGGASLPKGTSNLTFVANRYDGSTPGVDPLTTPVLETCIAGFTVTAK